MQVSVAVANGIVYIGSDDYTLYALNAATGAFIWSYTTGLYINGAPSVANGIVYVTSADYTLYALNATTGAFIWSYNTGYYLQTTPAVANGVVYLAANNDKLYALNATTGALLWSYTAGSYVISSPLEGNGVVYAASYSDDKVFALSAKNGKLLWSYTVGGPYLDGSPSLVNGMLYIGANDHKVYAFSLPAVMQASPSNLTFSAQVGGPNPSGQTVTLANTGGTAITWTECSLQPWLAVTPTTGGIAAGTNTSLTVTVDDTGLTSGTYSDNVVLVPSIGPVENVVVTFTVM